VAVAVAAIALPELLAALAVVAVKATAPGIQVLQDRGLTVTLELKAGTTVEVVAVLVKQGSLLLEVMVFLTL